MARLFVAILPPAAVSSEIVAIAAELPGVRWTLETNVHLTLRYIGEVTAQEETAFGDALARIKVEPFILPVGGVGLFPSRGPAKVAWAGVGNGHTRLYQLRKQVDEALLSVDLSLDVGHFHPHFTIARLDAHYEPKALAKFIARHTSFEAPPFRVSAFHLMASEVRPGAGPAYRPVRTFALIE